VASGHYLLCKDMSKNRLLPVPHFDFNLSFSRIIFPACSRLIFKVASLNSPARSLSKSSFHSTATRSNSLEPGGSRLVVCCQCSLCMGNEYHEFSDFQDDGPVGCAEFRVMHINGLCKSVDGRAFLQAYIWLGFGRDVSWMQRNRPPVRRKPVCHYTHD
jgi:hypothetical protein